MIFACNFFDDRELRDFVGDRHVGGDARSLFIAGIHTHVLNVVCLLASVAEVFDHFVVSVIERLSATDESAIAVETVLQRWREFVIAPSGPTARHRLAGILSKLLDVSDAVHASEAPPIGFWVGPFGAPHDLRCGSAAVEVKTTRSRSGHPVTTIHGADQLLAPAQGVSARLGVRVRKNDLGSRPTQVAAPQRTLVDVLDGDLIHEGNGRDRAVAP